MKIPPEVRAGFLDPQGIERLDLVPQGMSGGTVFRCREDDGKVDWALKCYPKGTAPARVREIHQVIGRLSRRSTFVPEYALHASNDGTWLVDRNARIWELQRWVSGFPLTADAVVDQVSTGAALIGMLHVHLASIQVSTHQEIHPNGTSSRPSEISGIPAVRQRVSRIDALDDQLPHCFRSEIDAATELRSPLVRALDLMRLGWERVSMRLRQELLQIEHEVTEPARMGGGLLQWVFRDIHREHLLFLNDQPMGIIDFDALRVDTPAADFARWLGSFRSFWQEPSTADQVLAKLLAETFNEQPLAGGTWWQKLTVAQTRTLIGVLARSSAWISLGNWLVWLILQRRTFASNDRVIERLDWLVEASATTL
ncbi:MAG: phosphotransferase [Planctomycetota bacterium]